MGQLGSSPLLIQAQAQQEVSAITEQQVHSIFLPWPFLKLALEGHNVGLYASQEDTPMLLS